MSKAHDLVARALDAVKVAGQDGAEAAIPEAEFAELCGIFAQETKLDAHLQALVVASTFKVAGLYILARQLVTLAETGLPLAERVGDRARVDRLKKSMNAISEGLGNHNAGLPPVRAPGVGIRTRKNN